jgi:hypothetical protein
MTHSAMETVGDGVRPSVGNRKFMSSWKICWKLYRAMGLWPTKLLGYMHYPPLVLSYHM